MEPCLPALGAKFSGLEKLERRRILIPLKADIPRRNLDVRLSHSRLARTGGRFSHVRCAPESGSRNQRNGVRDGPVAEMFANVASNCI